MDQTTNPAPVPIAVPRRDGGTVGLVPLTADHRPALARFLDELSPDARRFRFFQPVPIVTPTLLDGLVDVDQDRHVAWLAVDGDRVVAEARSVRSPDEPEVAEVALAVADDQRRRGLGRLLLHTLGLVARDDGVTAFSAEVMGENRASASLLRGLGIALRFADGALAGRGPVPLWPHGPALGVALLAARDGARATSRAHPVLDRAAA